jgi:predicted CXXCH cytochrome family protein
MAGMTSPSRIAALSLSAGLLLLARASVRGDADAPGSASVGSARCGACHEGVHRTWTSGRHSRMLRPATPETVIGDFAAGNVELRGRRYGLRVQNGRFVVRESLITGREHDRTVQYTLGSRRIQHYLTTLEDGRIVVLPPTWDVRRKQWFHNMEIVDPEESGEALHLQVWNTNCFGCHVSGQNKNFDPAGNTYGTDWQDFGTGCERCHGPGRAHASRYAASPAPPGGPTLIVRPTALTPQRETMVCAQCHSLRDITALGYTAGADYFDHFLPILEYAQKSGSDPAYWADGRPRRFSNDALGLWQSRCFLEGGATCTTCHYDPHLPDVERNRQLTEGTDALCVGCHEAIGRDAGAHTRHAVGSPGRSCVACHMPETVLSIKAQMRDHAIAVPAPENTKRHGIPNACNECHRDRTPEWAAGVLDTWGPGTARRRLLARADAFAGGRAGDARALPDLIRLADDERADPLTRANALGYLRRFPEARALQAAERAVASRHALVRAIAVLTVGDLAQDAASARSTLVPALRDPNRTVRVGAAFALAAKGVAALPGEDGRRLAEARADYAARAAFLSDDAGAQLDLGKFLFLGGEYDRAAQAFESTLRLRPDTPGGAYFLGLSRLGQGRTKEGRERLQSVPAADPYFDAARGVIAKLDRR